MIREAIAKLVAGQSLDFDEAAQVMDEIVVADATPAQFGTFVTALRLKGETAEEIAGMATTMRHHATAVITSLPVIDTCGTGGDASGTFNISTAAAFVAAGAGLVVAKHGNRAMTSKCGSADVLEALGVVIDLGPEDVAACLHEAGIGFMFAPRYHPAMRYATGLRREIGIRTVFNILGPLTNPAGARRQVLGVPEASLVEKMAEVLLQLEAHHALVVHGEDGLDELTLNGSSCIAEVKDGAVRTYTVTPEKLGLRHATAAQLCGGTAAENAQMVRELLAGPLPANASEDMRARRDVILLNAAAALVAGDKAETLSEGVQLAASVIDSGNAGERIDKLVAVSKRRAADARL